MPCRQRARIVIVVCGVLRPELGVVLFSLSLCGATDHNS